MGENKVMVLWLWAEGREVEQHTEWINLLTCQTQNTIIGELVIGRIQFSFKGEMGFEEWWVIEVHHCGESGSVKYENLSSKAFAMHFN